MRPDGRIEEKLAEGGAESEIEGGGAESDGNLGSGDEESIEEEIELDNELETEEDPLDMLAMALEIDLDPDELAKHQEKKGKVFG